MSEQRRHRRPAMLDPAEADQIEGDEDPAVRSEIAHSTAHAMVTGGRQNASDAAIVERLVTLVDTEGLDAVATLWSRSPHTTLPGTLWRLYLLREWVKLGPDIVADRYRRGLERAEVAGVIAGVADAPGPEEIRRAVDQVLTGVYDGDFAVTLERAGAFLRVLATGSAMDADWIEDDDHDLAHVVTRRAGALLATAEELEEAAALHRQGRLS
ncbi:hypothetical protein [Bogoriella caseilytica]|uniref:DNA-directed RNA polymerase subunit beta n=1 Tax=Bogoriella caseilytica TaxID=56055 RepID=A0A3N2BB63_9MICO|nr:hypothetical protein [Bogoriella caseilytica]ROR72500.1 hypothetical protein EDD31_0851 [Bogoriella caseilytica]